MSTPPPPHCHDAGARLEDGHAVVHVRAGLAVGEAVEEAAEAQPLGLLLLLALRVLEVAKVCAARAMSGQAGLRPLGARPAPLAPRPRAANPWWRHRAPLPLLNESRQLSPTGCHAQVTSLAIQATAAPTHASHRAHAQAPAPPPPPARARLHAHVIYPARCHRASWGWARRAGHHTGPILPGNRTPYIRSL